MAEQQDDIPADPADKLAQVRRGLALQAARRDAEAAVAFAAALACDPDLIDAQYGLASALAATGAHADALARFDALLAAAPDLAEAQYGRASVLQALGRLAEAEQGFAAALARDPGFAEAASAHAGTLVALGRPEEAVADCEHALALDPGFVEARRVLGAALAAQRRFAEAIQQWREVLTIAPDNVAVWRQLAGTLQHVGRAEEAAAAFREVLARAPDDADSHAGLGAALSELGELAAAEQAFERAIALEPARLAPYLMLVNARRIRPGEPLVARLEAMAARRTELPVAQQITLCFVMHKLCSDIGQEARGFAFLNEGAALRRGQLAYDEEAVLSAMLAPREVFTPALLTRHAGQGDPSELPVFIVGMPRSGSTLIEQVLSSHPRVIGGGERPDFGAALRAVARHDGPAMSGVAMSGAEFVASLSPDLLRRLAASYLDRLAAAAAGTKANPLRITDKLLDNFRYVGLIRLALPNARIIHTRRDPVDTCLSCYSKLFAAAQPHTYDLGTLGRYWRGYDMLMAHWRAVLPPGAMLEVQYETVVADFEAQARRVVAYCGLDWDDACLDFHRNRRPVRTASIVQVRQPIYTSSVGRWRPDAATLRPLLEGLGPDEAGSETSA